MGIVPKPSQIILLVEGSRDEQLVRKYLKRLNYEPHEIRTRKSPSGAGSGEQWVREQFAIECEARRRLHVETKLIVVIDADTSTVQRRLGQLDQALREAGVRPIPHDTREILRLVPKRNVETWILCLNNEEVDEESNYKRSRVDWTASIRTAADQLFEWTRRNARVPPACVESLATGIQELRKLEL
jgi:hypothetical protein